MLRHLHGVGEPAGLLEGEQLADDVLRVVLPREDAHRRGLPARSCRGAVTAGILKPPPAMEADDRVQVFPEELTAEIGRKGDVAVGKGVDHEERIEIVVKEAVKGVSTVCELPHYRTSHVKCIGRHCNQNSCQQLNHPMI